MPGLSLRNDLLYSHGWLLDKDLNPVASASAIWSLESESGEAIEHGGSLLMCSAIHKEKIRVYHAVIIRSYHSLNKTLV